MFKRLARSLAYSPRAVRLLETLEARLPPLRHYHRAQYQRHFARVYQYERIFSGVFPDYASALAAIPRDRPVGYDNPAAATFLGSSSPMLPCEYPALFWLTRLLPANPRVFDFGGYLGLNFNWAGHFGIFPEALHWTIYDVPAVIREGRSRLERTPDPRLHFTTDLTRAAAADVFFASGSLHFCEEPIATMLSRLTRLPPHLLINKSPGTDQPTFFTLNNMGPAISPYKIANRSDLLTSLAALGYDVIDAWKNPDLTCFIPFHPDQAVHAFDGYYLRLRHPS